MIKLKHSEGTRAHVPKITKNKMIESTNEYGTKITFRSKGSRILHTDEPLPLNLKISKRIF